MRLKVRHEEGVLILSVVQHGVGLPGQLHDPWMRPTRCRHMFRGLVVPQVPIVLVVCRPRRLRGVAQDPQDACVEEAAAVVAPEVVPHDQSNGATGLHLVKRHVLIFLQVGHDPVDYGPHLVRLNGECGGMDELPMQDAEFGLVLNRTFGISFFIGLGAALVRCIRKTKQFLNFFEGGQGGKLWEMLGPQHIKKFVNILPQVGHPFGPP
mmetsp:Transcript_22199/g.44485  ORF Transcript_22199/g.44485 Transcript_22199/m.44485 type:complete len:209 (-) Transcript_22199:108-734(-)